MTRRRITQQLAAGAQLLYRRYADQLTAWVAAGRRDDLTGWAAALGPLVRLVILAGAALAGYRILRAVPWLMWLLTVVGTWAAWRAPRRPASDVPDPVPSADPVLTVLWECLGDRDRVHLSTVLAHLQDHGQARDWTVTDLRLRLEALGIPVRPKVKIGGVPTRGVLAADLPPLSRPDRRETPSGPSPAL